MFCCGLKASLTPKRRAHTGMSLPDAWLEALAAYELMPISWRLEGQTGLGAALFQPDTGTVAVFQAYGGEDGPSPQRQAAVAAVLSGLRHDLPGPPDFRIYGLSFVAPPDFSLAAFEFVPGRFSLSFASGRRRLDVVRLAAADVLLAQENLGALAARIFGFDPSIRPEPAELCGMPAVWLSCRQGSCWLTRLARLCGSPGRLAVMRRQTDVDKLLGVSVISKNSVDRQWLVDVASNCVSL